MKELCMEQLSIVSGGLKNPFAPLAEKAGYSVGKVVGKATKKGVDLGIDTIGSGIKVTKDLLF